MAMIADAPYKEIKWKCAGIDHVAWLTNLEHKGKNLYPIIRGAIEHKETLDRDPVRFEA